MAKIVKTVRIEESLIEKLVNIADSEFGGNMTAALESCVSQAANLRVMPIDVRWGIYSKAKEQVISDMAIERGTQDECKVILALTSALGI